MSIPVHSTSHSLRTVITDVDRDIFAKGKTR